MSEVKVSFWHIPRKKSEFKIESRYEIHAEICTGSGTLQRSPRNSFPLRFRKTGPEAVIATFPIETAAETDRNSGNVLKYLDFKTISLRNGSRSQTIPS